MKSTLLILVIGGLLWMPILTDAVVKPVVYFSFDNISGDTVPDLSGSGNDGTMQDNPSVIDGQLVSN